jgi:hypothetical protein
MRRSLLFASLLVFVTLSTHRSALACSLRAALVVRVTPSLAWARRKLANFFARLQKVRHTHLPLWPALLADHLRGRWLLLIRGRWLLLLIRDRWLLLSALPTWIIIWHVW